MRLECCWHGPTADKAKGESANGRDCHNWNSRSCRGECHRGNRGWSRMPVFMMQPAPAGAGRHVRVGGRLDSFPAPTHVFTSSFPRFGVANSALFETAASNMISSSLGPLLARESNVSWRMNEGGPDCLPNIVPVIMPGFQAPRKIDNRTSFRTLTSLHHNPNSNPTGTGICRV